MRAIPTGARGAFTMVVSPEHLANRFKDATLPAMLSTPVMIMAMENDLAKFSKHLAAKLGDQTNCDCRRRIRSKWPYEWRNTFK